MPQGYEIPIGLDLNELITGIDKGKAKIVELVTQAEAQGKAFEKSFDGASDSIDNFVKGLEKAKQEGQLLGQDLKKSLEKGLDDTAFQKKLSTISKAITDITKNGNIGVNIDTAKIAVLERLLASTTDEAEQLNAVLQFSKDILNSLDPKSEQFQDLAKAIAFTEGALQGYNSEVKEAQQTTFDLAARFDDVYGELQPMTTRLGELEDRMYELKFAGKENTDEFRALQAEAIKMRRTIIEVDNSVDTFVNKTAKFDLLVESATGLVGALTAVQGATALFGDESKELNETIAKTQGAIALLQGIQATLSLLNKDSALSAFLLARGETAKAAAATAATGAMTAEAGATVAADVATKSLWATLLANPITAIVAGLAAAAAAVYQFFSANNELQKQLDNINGQYDREQEVLDLTNNSIKRRYELEKAVNESKKDPTKSSSTKIEIQELKDREKAQNDFINFTVEAQNKLAGNTKATGEDLKKYQDAQLKAEEERKDILSEIKTKEIELQKQKDDEAKQLREKRIAEERKAYEERKKISDLILQFTREARDIEISLVEDEFEKQRQEVNNKAKVRLEDLERQKQDLKRAFDLRIEDAKKSGVYSESLIKKERGLLAKAGEERNKLTEQIEKERLKLLNDIAIEEQKKKEELRFNALQFLADFYETGGEREARLLKLQFEAQRKQINEQYKDDANTRIELLRALSEKENEETVNLILQNSLNKAKVQQESDLLILDILELNSSNSLKITRQTEDERLKIQIKGIDEQLNALELAGVKENDTRVLQLQKSKALLQKQLKDNAETPVTIFDLLGLDSTFSENDLGKIKDGLSSFYNNVKSITSDLEALYQRQIDKRQEQVDKYDESIDKLDQAIEKEREAQKRGDANNLADLQRQKAEQERLRQDELTQIETYQKKQQALQRAQQIADTAIGASNLIVASTNIFKDFSKIPFVGVPLAIGVIATMIGAFAASKVRAFKELSDLPKFGDGGEITDGDLHVNGGTNINAEKGEFVTKRVQTQKFKPLLEMINNGENNEWLSDIQTQIGESKGSTTTLIKDGLKQIKQYKKNDNGKMIVVQESKEATARLDKLISLKEGEVQAYEDNEYYYVKQGNTIKKSRKK